VAELSAGRRNAQPLTHSSGAGPEGPAPLHRATRLGQARQPAERDRAVDGGDPVEDRGVLGLQAGHDSPLSGDGVAVGLLGALQRPQRRRLSDDLGVEGVQVGLGGGERRLLLADLVFSVFSEFCSGVSWFCRLRMVFSAAVIEL
jgi:hypothetical protein